MQQKYVSIDKSVAKLYENNSGQGVVLNNNKIK